MNQQGQVEHMSKDLALFIEDLGYKTIESQMVYVHRTLTREVMVYEKTWYFFTLLIDLFVSV